MFLTKEKPIPPKNKLLKTESFEIAKDEEYCFLSDLIGYVNERDLDPEKVYLVPCSRWSNDLIQDIEYIRVEWSRLETDEEFHSREMKHKIDLLDYEKWLLQNKKRIETHNTYVKEQQAKTKERRISKIRKEITNLENQLEELLHAD